MRKLLIVCEEELRTFGDFLSQLISLKDDLEDQTIGTKDGEVAATVWLEKDYLANSPQISSEQYIIFIGNSNLFKEKRTHITNKYSKFGMNYGWLGKQSVLYVDNVVTSKNYEDFKEYLLNIESDIKNAFENIKFIDNNNVKINIESKNLINIPFVKIADSMKVATIESINTFTRFKNLKKIKHQEYSCLLLVFYLEGLSEFLSLNN